MQVAHITGHRPNVMNLPYDLNKYQWNPLRVALETALVDELHVDKLLTGMALGIDQLAAEVASRNGIPFVAVIPFEGQESKWPTIAQQRYQELLDIADEQIVVSPGGYAVWKMQRRNEWMVDHSGLSVAVWNGKRTGGTWNCIRYAAKASSIHAEAGQERIIYAINSSTANGKYLPLEEVR